MQVLFFCFTDMLRRCFSEEQHGNSRCFVRSLALLRDARRPGAAAGPRRVQRRAARAGSGAIAAASRAVLLAAQVSKARLQQRKCRLQRPKPAVA